MLATGLSSFWAFWGIIENFHEGWYSASLAENLGLMAVQYLAPFLIFLGLTLVAIRWPYLGAGLFVATGLALGLFFFRGGFSPTVLITCPLAALGLLFAYGRPMPRRWALRVAAALPLLTLVLSGIGPAWMVVTRDKTVELQAQTVHGLIWAPAGPGWPEDGVSWDRARDICDHLSPDGTRLMATEQNSWRLPTVEEAVAAMTLHRRNSGGRWDGQRAIYDRTPDKEAPLWNPQSKVIYWWTATEAAPSNAWIIVYNGSVWPRSKKTRQGDLAFRAVRKP